MATNASWTVVFDDKIIIKNNGPETGTGYTVEAVSNTHLRAHETSLHLV